MENSMFEVRTIENADLAPNGNDGGYGHAMKNLEHAANMSREVEEEIGMSDLFAQQLVDEFLATRTIDELKTPGLFNKFAVSVQREISSRPS